MIVEVAAVQTARLMAEIEALSQFSDVPPPAVTRVLYTPTDSAARPYLRQLAEAAGLRWRTDAVGNHFMRWEGSAPEEVAVATGSHIDAIPQAGKYDGVVGVLGALEAVRTLQAQGFQPRRAIEIICFTAEEPTRFGVGCVGSRALSGIYGLEKLRSLRDSEGIDFETARQSAGFAGDLSSVAIAPGDYHAFVELHIEQGPILEAAQVPIGVVTGVAASARAQITFTAGGGHAGTVPMSLRHDPLLAAAEAALAVEKLALDNAQAHAVGTVGKFVAYPGASNSIPSQVTMSVDFRAGETAVCHGMIDALAEIVAEIAGRRQTEWQYKIINTDIALVCPPALVQAVTEAAEALKLPHQPMISRAYHDTVFMSRICPASMIFIPCRHGYSHRPEEYAAPEHIAQGVAVLAKTLAGLAQ